jgi:hypothetical protein
VNETPAERLRQSRQRIQPELARGSFADAKLAGTLLLEVAGRFPLTSLVLVLGAAALIVRALPRRTARPRAVRPMGWKAILVNVAWHVAEGALLAALQPRAPKNQAPPQLKPQATASKKA